MGTSGKTWTSATAVCPRPDHAGSHVRFDGRYGTPAGSRQRYRCIPTNGDPPHRFSAELQREHGAGEPELVARAIAGALVAAGAGKPYRQAAAVAGQRARQVRPDADTGERPFTRRGQLVMDWIETFAPVLFEPHRPTTWPRAGTLLLADLPFSLRAAASARPRIALRILCAAGYENERLRLWRLEAFADDSRASWAAFLRGLDGMPQRVVCDGGAGLTDAVRDAFEPAELCLCERRLKHDWESLTAQIQRGEPRHRAAIDALRPGLEGALGGASFWHAFVRDALAAGIPRLTAWLTATDVIVEAQLRRHGSSIRPRSMPLTTAPMDSLTDPIRAAIAPRRCGFSNPERLNRLLMLMQLDANRVADERAYATTIRAWLEAADGGPHVDRRALTDVSRIASL